MIWPQLYSQVVDPKDLQKTIVITDCESSIETDKQWLTNGSQHPRLRVSGLMRRQYVMKATPKCERLIWYTLMKQNRNHFYLPYGSWLERTKLLKQSNNESGFQLIYVWPIEDSTPLTRKHKGHHSLIRDITKDIINYVTIDSIHKSAYRTVCCRLSDDPKAPSKKTATAVMMRPYAGMWLQGGRGQ